MPKLFACLIVTMLAVPMGFRPAPAIAQTSEAICNSGPYRFDNVVAGLNNNRASVRNQLSAFGYQARSAGCQIRIECATRQVTEAAQRQDANREGNQICNAARQMLTRIGFIPPRQNFLARQANTERRNEIAFTRVPATSGFPVGSVLVYLVPGSN